MGANEGMNPTESNEFNVGDTVGRRLDEFAGATVVAGSFTKLSLLLSELARAARIEMTTTAPNPKTTKAKVAIKRNVLLPKVLGLR